MNRGLLALGVLSVGLLLSVGTMPSALSQPQPKDTFVDEFDDGVVDSTIYLPVGGATLVESGGELVVTPAGPGSGVLILSPLPAADPVSSTNRQEAWRYTVDFLPVFAAPDSGELTIESLGDDGGLIRSRTYDNAADVVFASEGDGFGGVTTTAVATFMEDITVLDTDGTECHWLPPGWLGTNYGGWLFPPHAYCKFKLLGTAPIDTSLNQLGLSAIRITSTDEFRISKVLIKQAGQLKQTGARPWEISPTHVGISGGDAVTITAHRNDEPFLPTAFKGFNFIGPFSITVNGFPATNVVVQSNTKVTFDVPPGAQGTATVRLLSDDLIVDAIFDNALRYFASAEPLLLSRDPLPIATVGTPYNAPITATGGGGPPTIGLASGNLAPGIALVGGGLSGTPTTPGVFAFFVVASDATGEEDLRLFFIEVRAE